MSNLEWDVCRFVNNVVRERLADDPIRLIAYRNLTAYLENNDALTASQRHDIITLTFGNHNQDLTQLVYTLLQDYYDDILLNNSLEVRFAKLNKVGLMCFCIQFMELFRQHISIHEPYYTTLSNLVHLYTIDQVPDYQLRAHINHVLYRFPDFRNQLHARLSTMTELFNIVLPPGPGNPPPPPPQV